MTETQQKTAEKLAVLLRWTFCVLITATTAVLFGLLGWFVSLFIPPALAGSASTVISYILPAVFGFIGATIGARTMLSLI